MPADPSPLAKARNKLIIKIKLSAKNWAGEIRQREKIIIKKNKQL
jgi:hypothetical protein